MLSDRIQQAIKDLILDSDGQSTVSDVVITFRDVGDIRRYTATWLPTGDTIWRECPISKVEFDADHEEEMIDAVLDLSDTVWRLQI